MFEARQKAGDNEWIKASLNSLERYARQREIESFSKEAMYKSEKMSSRKVSQAESRSDLSYDAKWQVFFKEN